MVRALARVDLGAISRNCAAINRAIGDGTRLCAVLKGDAYGHGAVQAGHAALAGGAAWLAVATAREAAQLRAAGLDAPLLVMGALSEEELGIALAARADVVAWREDFVAAIAAAAADEPVGVHVKLDTGMGRLGTRDPAEATAVARAVAAAAPRLRLAGAMTHFATADDDDPAFMREQLSAFVAWADPLRAEFPGIMLHVANSAAALRGPDARFDLVRVGVAIYGLDPFQRDPAPHGLEPALSLHSYVCDVKLTLPGQSAGYGRGFIATEPTWLGTIPIGYGDGVRRELGNNSEVVVDGRRFPLVGTVSMDNATVDLGPDGAAAQALRGAPVTLLGAGISAEELAGRIGTINYEVTTGIGPRVPREYVES